MDRNRSSPKIHARTQMSDALTLPDDLSNEAWPILNGVQYDDGGDTDDAKDDEDYDKGADEDTDDSDGADDDGEMKDLDDTMLMVRYDADTDEYVLVMMR